MQSKTVPPSTARSPREKACPICSQEMSILDIQKYHEWCGPLVLFWQCDSQLDTMLTPGHLRVG